MKKLLPVFPLILLFLCHPQICSADWVLYDDFNSGAIDTNKWDIDDSSATISVENGKAKFVHKAGYPDDTSWLTMNQNADEIRGIKLTLSVPECTGDVRARVSGYSGKINNNYVYSSIQVQPNRGQIYTYSVLESPSSDYLYDLALNYFSNPTQIIGKQINLKMIFYDEKVTYEAEGLGMITYRYDEAPNLPDKDFKGIGTKSTNGEGPCSVYIDDVYVYKNNP